MLEYSNSVNVLNALTLVQMIMIIIIIMSVKNIAASLGHLINYTTNPIT